MGTQFKAVLSYVGEKLRLRLIEKTKLPALSASGPLISSQLRTGTGEMLRATLASGLYSNIDVQKTKHKTKWLS